MSREFVIRAGTDADCPGIAALLGEAFQTGDITGEYLFPDEQQRRIRQPKMFAAMIENHFLPDGGVDVAVSDDSGEIVGAILWSRSWHKRPLNRQLKEYLALGAAMKFRAIAGMKIDAVIAKGKPSERHIYVTYLGVRKAWDGYGVGPALVDQLRRYSDADGIPLAANCQKELLPLYADLLPDGVVTGIYTLGRDGPKFYSVRRDPVA
jgi:L-amino acid N-acyltransferase YncA